MLRTDDVRIFERADEQVAKALIVETKARPKPCPSRYMEWDEAARTEQ